MLKKIPISTSYIGGGKMNQAFSTYFETNGTHLKCYSNEKWAQHWVEFANGFTVPCNTSNSHVANIEWW